MKKLKIIPYKHINTNLACYNPNKNEIYYNEGLDNFPNLKRFILNHEKKHSKKPKDYFYHLETDFLDYPKIQLNDKLIEEYYDLVFKKENKSFMDFIYIVVNWIIRVILLPLLIYSLITYLIIKLEKFATTRKLK